MGDGKEMKEIHQKFLTGERALFREGSENL